LLVPEQGNDLAGTASALRGPSLANSFEANPRIKKLLQTTTVYIFPRLNPDSTERFFLMPRQETAVNRKPSDDDHDGLVDEDAPDDLNGDGLITSMRIQDPEGEYVLDPADPRLLIKADRAKGETGTWRLLMEGRDNDGDREFNEDGQAA
jgi:hypothetical protein